MNEFNSKIHLLKITFFLSCWNLCLLSPSQTRNIFIVTVTATNILITFTTPLPVNGLYFVIITTTIEKYLITPLCYLSLNKKFLSFFWLFVCVKTVSSMTVLIAAYDSLSQYFKSLFLCFFADPIFTWILPRLRK